MQRRPAAVALVVTFVATLAAVLSQPAAAGVYALGMSAADSIVQRAGAGERLTVVVAVPNAGIRTLRIEVLPVLPPQWSIVSGGGRADVAPGTTRTEFVQVRVPLAAAPGIYEIRVEVREPGSSRLLAVHERRVEVLARDMLEVEALEAPRIAPAGSTYTARFVVRNRGNTRARVRAEAVELAGFVAIPEWREADLEAGGMRELAVSVQTDRSRPAVLRHTLEVRVQAPRTARPDSLVIASASTSVLVLAPADANEFSRFHELPVEARMVVTSGRAGAGSGALVTGELSGRGPIADGSATYATVRVRRSRAGNAMLADADEYMLAVDHPSGGVRLGDGVYSLSPLTEPGRYGTGAAVHGMAGSVSLQAMLARDRRIDGAPTVAGAGAAYTIGRLATVGANVMRRSGADSAMVASVRIRSAPHPLAVLDAESAQGVGASGARAIAATLSGATDRVTYSVHHVGIPSDFPNIHRGTRTDAASAALRIAGPLRAQAAASRQRTTRDWVWSRQSIDVRTWEAGVGIGGAVTVSHVRTAIVTDSTAGGEDGEALVRLQLRGSAGPLSAGASALAGRVEHDGVRSMASEVTVHANVRIGARAVISGSILHHAGSRWHTRAAQEVTAGSLRAVLTPVRDLTVDLGGSATRRRIPTPHDFLSVDGALRYRTGLGHTVSLSARSQSAGTFDALAQPIVQAGYSLPFGVPVGQSRRASRVVGRVYDSETGRGVPNTVVVIGERMALTDGDGRVVMNGLTAGSHPLQLQLPGTISDRVPQQHGALAVTTRPGDPARVDIPLVRGARITGTVRRLAPSSEAQWDGSRATLADAAGVPGLVVSLARDGELVRRMTDNDGVFDATGLRPGRWTVSVDAADLPAHHYLDVAERILEVTPGQRAGADFTVLPRKRTIVMIDQAVVDAGGSVRPKPVARPAERARATAPRAAPQRIPAWSDLAPTPRHTAAPTASAPPAAGLRSFLFLRQSFYFVGEADRTLRNIALLTYGDAAMWPKLWLANRNQVGDPDAVPAGMLLVVPPREPLTAAEIRARDAWLRTRPQVDSPTRAP